MAVLSAIGGSRSLQASPERLTQPPASVADMCTGSNCGRTGCKSHAMARGYTTRLKHYTLRVDCPAAHSLWTLCYVLPCLPTLIEFKLPTALSREAAEIRSSMWVYVLDAFRSPPIIQHLA